MMKTNLTIALLAGVLSGAALAGPQTDQEKLFERLSRIEAGLQKGVVQTARALPVHFFDLGPVLLKNHRTRIEMTFGRVVDLFLTQDLTEDSEQLELPSQRVATALIQYINRADSIEADQFLMKMASQIADQSEAQADRFCLAAFAIADEDTKSRLILPFYQFGKDTQSLVMHHLETQFEKNSEQTVEVLKSMIKQGGSSLESAVRAVDVVHFLFWCRSRQLEYNDRAGAKKLHDGFLASIGLFIENHSYEALPEDVRSTIKDLAKRAGLIDPSRLLKDFEQDLTQAIADYGKGDSSKFLRALLDFEDATIAVQAELEDRGRLEAATRRAAEKLFQTMIVALKENQLSEDNRNVLLDSLVYFSEFKWAEWFPQKLIEALEGDALAKEEKQAIIEVTCDGVKNELMKEYLKSLNAK